MYKRQFIDSLNGFPGPYSSYVYDTIGNKGIIRLLENIETRDAKFVAIIAYCNGVDDIQLFESSIPGKISSFIEKGVGAMIQFSFLMANQKPMQTLQTKTNCLIDHHH